MVVFKSSQFPGMAPVLAALARNSVLALDFPGTIPGNRLDFRDNLYFSEVP
jgi:hypothetical protein